MVIIIRGNRHHVKHSCRSDASHRVAGDILLILPSAPTALLEYSVAPISYLNIAALIWRYNP
eukprot:6181733-Pleurochrysis_carterae.AAC.3